MKPPPFDYVRPASFAEAASIIGEHGANARILAGGQSLVAMLNMRVARPQLLVDISRLDDANYIRVSHDDVAVGCTTSQRDLEHWPSLAADLPLVARALPWVGHEQTRSSGTVCGSIAHADPSSELPLCLSVMNGSVVVSSHGERRVMPARSFFTGMLQTACADHEVIEEVRFPRGDATVGSGFREVAMRHGDFAIVAIAVMARGDGLTIGVGGATDRPETCDWPVLEGSALTDALNDWAWSLDCQDDLHATASYRRKLIRSLGKLTIEEALQCRS